VNPIRINVLHDHYTRSKPIPTPCKKKTVSLAGWTQDVIFSQRTQVAPRPLQPEPTIATFKDMMVEVQDAKIPSFSPCTSSFDSTVVLSPNRACARGDGATAMIGYPSGPVVNGSGLRGNSRYSDENFVWGVGPYPSGVYSNELPRGVSAVISVRR
jgi:hypothetical protein